MQRVIRFWAEKDKYGCFSNFHPCYFNWKGLDFNCSEQAFMYSKAKYFNDDETALEILNESNPKIIKKLGRKVKNFSEHKWADVRYNFMLTINKEKYQQNPELKKILLSTGNAIIEEDSPYDYIWGTGRDGSGSNLLGKILMEIRDYFNSVDAINEV